MEKPVPGPKSQYATILRGLPFLNSLPSYSRIEHSMSKILGKYNHCHYWINFEQGILF